MNYDRTWHSGPPPHVGWWNASVTYDRTLWRWWDGEIWSWGVGEEMPPEQVGKWAKRAAIEGNRRVKWTDYYPANARVPR